MRLAAAHIPHDAFQITLIGRGIKGVCGQLERNALFPTAVRTQATLLGGVDVVLSLPAPFATLSAEGFADAGVRLLAALGVCDTLAFGAETADVALLQHTAEILRSAPYAAILKIELGKGVPYAVARGRAADALCNGCSTLLAQPNNTLGVEYCKALANLQAETDTKLPQPFALARKGAAHDAPLAQGADGFASATALRAITLKHGVSALQNYVPAACMSVYTAAVQAGRIANPAAFSVALLSRLRAMTADDFAAVRGVSEGLENRLFAAVQQAGDLEELYTLMKTKRYAHARMRRLALDAALGYTALLPEIPPYLHVLGATKTGLAVLKEAKSRAKLPLSHSLASLADTSAEAHSVAKAHAAAEDLAALCLAKPQPRGTAYTDKIITLS